MRNHKSEDFQPPKGYYPKGHINDWGIEPGGCLFLLLALVLFGTIVALNWPH